MTGITRLKDMHSFQELNTYYQSDLEADQLILDVEEPQIYSPMMAF